MTDDWKERAEKAEADDYAVEGLSIDYQKAENRKVNWFVSMLNDYKQGKLDDASLCQLVLLREAVKDRALEKAEAELEAITKEVHENGKIECESVEMSFDPKATASIVKGLTDDLNKLRAEVKAVKNKLAQWEAADRIGVKKWVDFATEIKSGMEKERLALKAEVRELREALVTCLEYFDDRADIKDAEGQNLPNEEMKLTLIINSAIKKK